MSNDRVEVVVETKVYTTLDLAGKFLAEMSELACKYDPDAVVSADPKSVAHMEGLPRGT
jgi:hypothetical protein